MRLVLALAAAQSLGLFLHSDAFAPSATTSLTTRKPVTDFAAPSSSLLHVGVDTDGWENDDFLKSLAGQNPEAKEEIPEEDMDGADLTPEMRAKIKQQNEADESPGGSKFKELLAAASKNKTPEDSETRSLKNPFVENPFIGIEGLDPTMDDSDDSSAAPAAAPAANTKRPEDMTVEEQAEMFRAMMAGQQAPPAAQKQKQTIKLPEPRPPKPDRKTGRNRDADAIQNTADVYFAQLKRDSTVRGIARIRGDEDMANAIFEDSKIEELKTLISENPHLAEKRDEEKKQMESAADEMQAYQASLEAKRGDPKSAGVSYKQRLEEKRNKRGGGGAAAVAATPIAPPAPAPPVPEPVAVVEPPQPKVEATPTAFAVAAPVVEEPKAQPVAQPPVQPAAVVAPPQTQQSTSAAPKVTVASSSDVIRREIRTLMGLILKHRGGPGFGTGGLKGNELAQYEQLMGDVTALLKAEAMANVGTEPPTPIAQAAPAQAASAATPAAPSPSSELAPVESILVALDGAVMMYRNSPAELQSSVLSTLRAALLAAVNACNSIMNENEGVPATSAAAGAQVEPMLACVEGATLMYRNSPPELQVGILPVLRAALLSAVGTCNKIIADGEIENFQQYQEATADIAKPAATEKETQFFEYQPKPAAASAAPTVSIAGNDKNSQKLEGIYNTLQAAGGDGKMGLRDDLSSAEATEVADGIAEMRAIMMEELETGVPESTTGPAPAVVAAPEQTISRYQQMLAEAKAEKANEA